MVQVSGADHYVYNKLVSPPGRREKARVDAAGEDAADAWEGVDGWGDTLSAAARASGPDHYEASSFREKGAASRARGRTSKVAARVHKRLHARIKAKAPDRHSTAPAQRPARARPRAEGGDGLDEWPAGAWKSFSGSDETGADYPALHEPAPAGEAPHEDWPAVKWGSRGAQDETKLGGRDARARARTHMLGAPEDDEEGVEVSDDEKAEWFYNWTKDYNPGGLGSPGLHEGQVIIHV